MERLSIKAGETFTFPLVWDSGGVPVDLTGYTVTGQVRAESAEPDADPTAVLTCTPDPDQGENTGKVVVEYDGATSGWAVGPYVCDLLFVSPGGIRKYTPTFRIDVIRPVTR